MNANELYGRASCCNIQSKSTPFMLYFSLEMVGKKIWSKVGLKIPLCQQILNYIITMKVPAVHMQNNWIATIQTSESHWHYKLFRHKTEPVILFKKATCIQRMALGFIFIFKIFMVSVLVCQVKLSVSFPLCSQCLWSGEYSPVPRCLKPGGLGKQPFCLLRHATESSWLCSGQVRVSDNKTLKTLKKYYGFGTLSWEARD